MGGVSPHKFYYSQPSSPCCLTASKADVLPFHVSQGAVLLVAMPVPIAQLPPQQQTSPAAGARAIVWQGGSESVSKCRCSEHINSSMH